MVKLVFLDNYNIGSYIMTLEMEYNNVVMEMNKYLSDENLDNACFQTLVIRHSELYLALVKKVKKTVIKGIIS